METGTTRENPMARAISGSQLLKLRELANLQQEQIDNKNRVLLDKDQRRSYLSSLQIHNNNGQLTEFDQSMALFREKLHSQESRLHRLRSIKSQLPTQRRVNTDLCSELETMRIVFKEKERELSVANSKIDALTRQLDELTARSKTANSAAAAAAIAKGAKHLSELEKLRQELLYKSKLSQQNEQQLLHKRSHFFKSQSDELLLNSRVKSLQERLARKIEFNRQLVVQKPASSLVVAPNHDLEDELQRSQMALSASLGRAAAAAASNLQKRRPTSKPAATVLPAQNANVATVEPYQRVEPSQHQQQNQVSFIGTKQFSSDDSCASSKDKDSGISLVIHNKTTPDAEDDDDVQVPKDLLEDRPSPSGSSGSSDRISASYTFSSQKHRAYTSTNNSSSGSATDSGIDQIDRASFDAYNSRNQIAAFQLMDNKQDSNENFIPRIPGDGSNYNSEKSVSDLIKSFNRVSTNCPDWQRTKRRPVTDDVDLEKELAEQSQTIANFRSGSAASVDTISIEATGILPESDRAIEHDDDQAQELCELESFASSIDSSLSSLADVDDQIAGDQTFQQSDMNIVNNSDLLQMRASCGLIRPILRTGNRKPMRVRFDPLVLLLDAALEGELELVKNLASQVPNVSASNDEGITALHNATCAGHFEIVKYLVDIGFDVNAQDTDGWMPLHCAASCNNLSMIKFLVSSGAAIFGTTFTDDETPAQKCEEDEEGFDGCSQYLYGVQEQLGSDNGGIVYALYDYAAEREDELSFAMGDALQVLRKAEQCWWWARSADLSEGLIPRTFIGLYPRVSPPISQ